MNRSFLFVPGDSARKLARAADAGADALIVDLEDAVAPAAKADARRQAAAFVDGRADAWVRINPLDSDAAEQDLQAVMPAAPAGIVLPKARSAADVERLAAQLDLLERRHDVAAGATKILPLCTERPEAIFSLGSYGPGLPRLAGLTWGAEDLAAAVGATANRDDAGNWLPPYQVARALCLFAAAAAGVPAIDTVFTDFRDSDGLARYVACARRDGYAGMLAIHPGQVDIINSMFAPTADEIERAERIVALFEASPGAGTLGMDGQMIDRPHLAQAERIIELARRLTDK